MNWLLKGEHSREYFFFICDNNLLLGKFLHGCEKKCNFGKGFHNVFAMQVLVQIICYNFLDITPVFPAVGLVMLT